MGKNTCPSVVEILMFNRPIKITLPVREDTLQQGKDALPKVTLKIPKYYFKGKKNTKVAA